MYSILFLVLIIGVLLYLYYKNSKSGDSGCECKLDISCLKEGPNGKCFSVCDKEMDSCYNQCKDQECIKKCYERKATCYIDCMKHEQSDPKSCTVCACS